MKIYNYFVAIISLLFVSNCLFAGTYSGGTGTSGDPFQISSTADLIELSTTSADWVSGKYFIQTAHISFNANEQLVDWDRDGSATWDTEDQLGFSPIGNNSNYFQGIYDGQNHTISNLYINRAITDYVGLFGLIYGDNSTTRMKNLGLIDVAIIGHDYVGGLAGENNNYSNITNCYSTGSVNGEYYVGGLIGHNVGISHISNCYNNGSVNGIFGVGGLIGAFYSSNMNNCYSFGTASGNQYVGGLVGINDFSSNLTNSFSTCNVSGIRNVGGLASSNSNNSTISNCYCTGTVTRSSGTNPVFGGLCGINYNSIIDNCYSTSSVYSSVGVIWNEGGNKDKGFVGFNNIGSYSNNFFDFEISGQTSGIGATSKTTQAMKTQSTFTGWNFTPTTGNWYIGAPGYKSYPYFQGITYDTPGATPEVNPIPGLEVSLCQNTVYVDESYNDQTPGWGVTHFDNFLSAFTNVCPLGIINISNCSFNGDINLTGLTIIIGEQDFNLTGTLIQGFVQVTNTGRLVMTDITPEAPKVFPITDGTHNYTMTVSISNYNIPDVGVRIKNHTQPGNINTDFWDIEGPDNLNATVTLRIDKAAIAPKTLNSTSQLRYFDNGRYIPANGNNFSIEEFDTYYIITITGVDKF